MSAQRRGNKLATQLRAQRIWRMKLKGLTTQEIATQEKLSERAVRWHLELHQRVIDHKVRNLTVAIIAAELLASSEERIRQLWGAYLKPDSSETAKLNALAQLRDEDGEVVKHMQSLGLVHKEADRVELTVFMKELMDIVKEVIPDDRVLHRLARKLDQRAASLGGRDAARGAPRGSPAGHQPVH